MKLSEAIRKGSEGTEQYFGDFFRFRAGDHKLLACCALGAAWRGCFPDDVSFNAFSFFKLSEATGVDLTEEIEERLDSDGRIYIHRFKDEIAERNDDDRLSREEIADWLEGQGL